MKAFLGTLAAAALAALMLSAATPPVEAAQEDPRSSQTSTQSELDAGKYLLMLGGCNDCHTPGWTTSGGKVPEQEWLTGSTVGFRGPWGTTYAANLRLTVTGLPPEGWVAWFRTRDQRPPMPWFNYRSVSDQDLLSMYRFITSLGPAGEPVRPFVPPEQEPSTPFVDFSAFDLQ